MVNIIIVGGRRVGLRLIELLKRRSDYHITLITNDTLTSDIIEKKFPDVVIVKGDATNKTVLEKAGIESADIVVAATSIDEVNLLIGITSQEYNVEKIVARTSNPSHIKMFKKLGLNEAVSPELTACNYIETFIIKPSNVNELEFTSKGDCDIINVEVKSSKVIGKTIGEISPKEDYIILLCEKENTEYIAQNDIILDKHDIVTILVKDKSVKKVKKLFTKSSILSI